MSGHIVHDFKDLRQLITQVTKDRPAKTQYQQQAEKMGYTTEAEAKPKDDKGKSLGKQHAGEDEIKKAYIKLGRSAQGSIEFQRGLVQKQLAKMGFKTYSKKAFDDLFNVEQKDFDKFITIISEAKGFDDKQLDGLRKSYGDLKKINPTAPVGKKLLGMFKAMSKEELESIASAGINFLSLLAASNLITRFKMKANQINYVKAEEKKKKKWNEPLKGFPANEEIDEGKYLKYSDLLLAKSKAVDKYGPDSKVVQAINKDIKKEMGKLGIKEGAMSDLLIDIQQGATAKEISKSFKIPLSVAKEFLKDYYGQKKGSRKESVNEGTWAVPDSYKKLTNLQKLFLASKKPASEINARKLSVDLYNIYGDDDFYDKLEVYMNNPDPKVDLRDIIIKYLKKWVEIKNYKITKAPENWVSNTTDEDVDIEEIVSEGKPRRGKGKIKRPSGKMIQFKEESRENKLKEQKEHAKQSPFKLKSQQYPRAIAINNDGFGKRHATVEDIIAACDTFGMIIDKELQIEQIQKQLGKTGFITYNKSELKDVFEERETQRIILTLESTVDDQKPIEYTKEEITEAFIMGEEIEFLKPDGLKTIGPVLKKGGNTYNVKDKFTGKSYTYKYIGETEVKTFDEIMIEGKFSSKLIKQAGGIAFDKRYYMGNMTGAISAIEKLKKGLSDDPKVKEMLRIANESVDENVDEEKDQRKYKKVQEWEDAVETRVISDGDKEAYQKFFNSALKKFGVSSPAELEGDKKKEFFNYVDKNWKGDHEGVEQDVHKTYKMDGRRKNFKEKMRKLGYIKGY